MRVWVPHGHLLVVDVDRDPLAKDQLHGGGVAELDSHLDDQVDALIGAGDPVQVDRVMDGGVPGAHSQHLETDTGRAVMHITHNT